MTPIKVRAYREEDKEAFGHIRSMTYRGGQAVPVAENLLRPDSKAFVAEREQQLVGAFTALDMTCTIGFGEVPCAGIAAVAVNPEARRGGIGAALMVDGQRLLKDNGYAIASLYPFRETYYRRFGYEVCGKRLLVTVPESRYPECEAELPVRTIKPEQWHQLRSPYEKFARRFTGMNLRFLEDQWWRTTGGDSPFTIYVAGDPIEAYALIRLSTDFWVEQTVREFVWTTKRGYDSMLALFRGIGINKASISWHEPSDSPYMAGYLDQGVTVKAERQLMFRILDVPKCLTMLEPSGEGEVNIRVHDEHMPENQGPWNVSFRPGRVDVQKAETAELDLDIRQLTQAVLGEPSLNTLVNAGAVCGDGMVLHEAQKLFTRRCCYCTDFF